MFSEDGFACAKRPDVPARGRLRPVYVQEGGEPVDAKAELLHGSVKRQQERLEIDETFEKKFSSQTAGVASSAAVAREQRRAEAREREVEKAEVCSPGELTEKRGDK